MKKLLILILLLTISASVFFKGIFFPFEMYIFLSALTLVSALYFALKIIYREKLLINDWSIYLGGALIFAYLLSFIKSVHPRGNIETLIQYAVYFIVFLVLFDFSRENKDRFTSFFFVLIICTGFIAAIIGLAGHTHVFPQLAEMDNNNRLGSTFQYANTAAIYFLMLVVLIISKIINSRGLITKAILAAAANIIFLALFFTVSRGVFLVVPVITIVVLIASMPAGSRSKCAGYVLCIVLPILASMKGYDANSQIRNIISAFKWVMLSGTISALCTAAFAFAIKLRLSKKIKLVAIYASAAIAAAAVLLNYRYIGNMVVKNIPQNVMARILDINLGTNSAAIRFVFYKDALKLIKSNWLFGLGGGGFEAMYQSVQDTYYAARLVHNHYLQVFAEAGILGFTAFSLLVVLTCIYFIYARFKIKDDKTSATIAGCFCAFLALALHSAIDFNLSYPSMSLIFWALMAIAAAYYRNARSQSVAKAVSTSCLPSPNSMGEWRQVWYIQYALILLSLVIVYFNVSFALAAHYAKLGGDTKAKLEIDKTIEYYTKAVKPDPLNAAYHSELADLYSWMAGRSETEKEKTGWLEKALTEGEEAVRLNPYYPFYNKALANIYFYSGQSVKACEQAIKLVSLQPRVPANYELLARGYLEAGLMYLEDGDVKKGAAYIRMCTDVNNYMDAPDSRLLAFYRGKAFLLLGKFEEAEQLLNKAREASLELKMDSDRLLFIINERTGRSDDNKKYKGVPWMGVVKLTPAYKEVTNILDSGLLERNEE